MNKNEIIRIECDCHHKGHFFAIEKWNDSSMIAIVCEADRDLPLWNKIKDSFWYLLGKKHLNYTEVILDRETTLTQIKNAIETL